MLDFIQTSLLTYVFSLCSSALSLLALTSVEGYHGYLLFAWMCGAFVGGLNFSLATFVLERSRIRHFARDWGFVQGRNSTAL